MQVITSDQREQPYRERDETRDDAVVDTHAEHTVDPRLDRRHDADRDCAAERDGGGKSAGLWHLSTLPEQQLAPRSADVGGRVYAGGMCASYGLDPRFTDAELLAAADDAVLEGLRVWARENAGETVRPTGKNLRNLNPLIVQPDAAPILEPAWWGFLVNGEPAKFPSINTRSERLQERPGGAKARAIVPATSWYEMQKPSRQWNDSSSTTAPCSAWQRSLSADALPTANGSRATRS
jgi:hypothetical protein